MIVRITPHFIQLISDATLKSFWRKKTLRIFLSQCGVSQSFLATWSEDETKRDFLEHLFQRLYETEEGHQLILQVANCLMEQTSFPDLKNWEESDNMIRDAYTSVERLKHFYKNQQEEIEQRISKEKTQANFRAHQQEIAESQESLQRLSDRLNALGKELGTQKAGYKFEAWFYDLMKFCEIVHRKPYVQDGRQIDGSITIKDTTYLVELKFTNS
jgi:DNA repair exonuclease SbcCD ATPase subunit